MTERRVTRLLGLSQAEARLLLRRARTRLGRRPVALRMAAFVVATAPLVRRILPSGVRRAGIRPLVYALIPGPAENLLYARVTPGSGEAEPR